MHAFHAAGGGQAPRGQRVVSVPDGCGWGTGRGGARTCLPGTRLGNQRFEFPSMGRNLWVMWLYVRGGRGLGQASHLESLTADATRATISASVTREPPCNRFGTEWSRVASDEAIAPGPWKSSPTEHAAPTQLAAPVPHHRARVTFLLKPSAPGLPDEA